MLLRQDNDLAYPFAGVSIVRTRFLWQMEQLHVLKNLRVILNHDNIGKMILIDEEEFIKLGPVECSDKTRN